MKASVQFFRKVKRWPGKSRSRKEKSQYYIACGGDMMGFTLHVNQSQGWEVTSRTTISSGAPLIDRMRGYGNRRIKVKAYMK